jgi:hypothetical protein
MLGELPRPSESFGWKTGVEKERQKVMVYDLCQVQALPACTRLLAASSMEHKAKAKAARTSQLVCSWQAARLKEKCVLLAR